MKIVPSTFSPGLFSLYCFEIWIGSVCFFLKYVVRDLRSGSLLRHFGIDL